MTRSLSWDDKGPFEVLDFRIDWADRFEISQPEVITSAVWTVPAGLVRGAESFDATTTTIWLSGGVLGKIYFVGCRITTSWNRVMDQTVSLKVVTNDRRRQHTPDDRHDVEHAR